LVLLKAGSRRNKKMKSPAEKGPDCVYVAREAVIKPLREKEDRIGARMGETRSRPGKRKKVCSFSGNLCGGGTVQKVNKKFRDIRQG